MPVAFTQEIINQPWTATLLRNTITTKLISLGYAQEGISGDDLFFSIDAPLSGAPKDRAFLRVNVTNNTATNIKIQTWFGDGYAANALVNSTVGFGDTHSGPANIGYSSNESFPIRFVTFLSPEIAWLGLVRNDNNAGLANIGFVFPSVKPTWWNNASLYAFAPNSPDAVRLRCNVINPFSAAVGEISFLAEYAVTAINPGGTRDLIRRLILSSNTGIIVGATTSDLGVLAATGLSPFSQLIADGQTWVNCRTTHSLAVRIL